MDAFSSSFLSSIPKPNVSYMLTKISSTPRRFNIYCVRIEDKPQTAVGSSSTLNISTTFPNSVSTITLPQRTAPSPTLTNSKQKSDSPRPKTTPTRRHKTHPPPPQPSLPTTIFGALEDVINKFIDPPTRPSIDPRFVLSENFAPVDELPPTECEIEFGVLPSCLDGAYIRNGPNPQFLPRGPYHLFDGDGMLHSIRISSGKATLCSRYVKTYKYTVERDAGTNLFPSFFSGFNGLIGSAARGTLSAARSMAGQFDPRNGFGVANTSLAFIGDKLYALGESDLPYEVKLAPNGDIQTLDRTDFDGKLFMSMTAHPKVDPDTGETFAFRFGFTPPFLTYFRFDSKGNKQADVPIFSMQQPTLLHDFAITKKYAIFPDIQLGMDPMEIIRGRSPVGLNPGKVTRIGILPRYASDESNMRWFEVPGFNMMHAVNAWDEIDQDGNEAIILVAPNILSAEHTLERMELAHPVVEKIRIDLKTGFVSRQPLSARNLEFPVINPAYVAKKNKYVYTASGDPMPKITRVVKLDVSMAHDHRDCTVGIRTYEPGCYGGEPFFVARDPDNPCADEDDGYVVSYVHNENTGQSRFLVMDAKSLTLDIVASVKLPQRVPYGFHGLFVKDTDLD